VPRPKQHPAATAQTSLALWCENNKLEQGWLMNAAPTMSWDDCGNLFDKLLLEVVRALDPDHLYFPEYQ
jgi:hypothetical protein